MPSVYTENRLFDGADPRVIAGILQDAPVRTLAGGHMLFDEGDEGTSLFLVGTGAVAISKTSSGARSEILSTFTPGTFFGEMSLLDGEPRSARAVAASPTELLEVNRETMDRLLAAAPLVISGNLLRTVNSRLRLSNEQYIARLLRAERLTLLGSMANTVMHDLRNYLSSTRFACEILGQQAQSGSELAVMAIKGIDDAFEMIQELLDFSRGQHRTTNSRFAANDLLADVEPALNSLTSTADISLALERRSDAFLSGDRNRLARCLLNLARNAVEAMPAGGRLTLESADDHENALVIYTVTDTGSGIAPEDLPRLFEPFFTVGKPGGTGLGLSIVHAIVTAHDGTIDVQSSPGKGSTFVIKLPNTS